MTYKTDRNTEVHISNYSIKNKILFGPNEDKFTGKQLNLELTFLSNDDSIEKYKSFLEDFHQFLLDSGWQKRI